MSNILLWIIFKYDCQIQMTIVIRGFSSTLSGICPVIILKEFLHLLIPSAQVEVLTFPWIASILPQTTALLVFRDQLVHAEHFPLHHQGVQSPPHHSQAIIPFLHPLFHMYQILLYTKNSRTNTFIIAGVASVFSLLAILIIVFCIVMKKCGNFSFPHSLVPRRFYFIILVPFDPSSFLLTGRRGSEAPYTHWDRVQFDKNVRDKFVQKVPLSQVKMLTKNFSDNLVVGTGGFGIVYKVTTSSGEVLAVKRAFETRNKDGFKEFEDEVTGLQCA